MRSFVYALVLLTVAQSSFAGGGNKDKSHKKGFFSRIAQALSTEPEQPRPYQHAQQRDEMGYAARQAYQERMHPRPSPPQGRSLQEELIDLEGPSRTPEARGPVTKLPITTTRSDGNTTSPFSRESFAEEPMQGPSELERLVQNDQREIERLETITASIRKEHCRLNEQLRVCTQRMTDQERQIETIKKRQFPKLARLEMMKSPALSNGVSDFMIAKTLIPALKAAGTAPIFLAIGNPYQEMTEEDETHLTTFFKNLPREAFILFDADSKAAPNIVKLTEGLGIMGISGIPGKTLAGATVAVITNPFLRMETILASESVIFSPDSVLGLGLQFEGVGSGKNLLVLEMGKKWTPGLAKWSDSLGNKRESGAYFGFGDTKNLGINYNGDKEPRLIGFEDLPHRQLPKMNVRRMNPSIPTEINQLIAVSQPALLEQAYEYAKGLLERQARLVEHLASLGVTETVAFFGSAEGGYQFEYMVQDNIRKISGILPIVTGGAGGYMRTANIEAKKTPGFSIGIPLGGRKNWKEETSKELDLEISAPGYEQRIPLIFDQETARHVLVAPGGMGTMKELATAIVAISTGQRANPMRIVFIGPKYYNSAVEWIKRTPLPTEFLDRIMLN